MTEKPHSEADSELSQASSESKAKAKGEPSTTPVYEVGFHIIPTVGDDGVAHVVDTIRKALGKAEIINDTFPERMTLAYTIERSVQGKREKYQDAYFGHIKFAAEKDDITAFQDKLRAMHEVLRYLVITTVREDAPAPRRVVFTSSRLEGETIKKPEAPAEKAAEVSEEELDKTIDALVSNE